METQALKEKIEKIIKMTFEQIDQTYRQNREGQKLDNSKGLLLFPQYRKNSTRVSEQELRFAFVEQFCLIVKKENLPLLYSIETPTEHSYYFQNGEISKDAKKCKSGCLDLVIYSAEDSKRICIIEFKANTPSIKYYKQDFFKLYTELTGGEGSKYSENAFGFIVQLIRNTKSTTVDRIKEKTLGSLENTNKVKHICFSLENGQGGEIVIGE